MQGWQGTVDCHSQEDKGDEEEDMERAQQNKKTHKDKKKKKQQLKADLSRCVKGAKPSSGGSAGIPNLCCPLSPGPLHASLHTIRQTCIQRKRAS